MSAFLRSMSTVPREWFFLLLAMLAVGLYVLLADSRRDSGLGFPLDDSWIHQTYARNLAERGEWAFVAGEPSAASTAPLYSGLLAVGHLLNLAPFFWAHLLGVLALALGASLAARIGEQLFPAVPCVGLATGLMVLLAWHLIWAAASGMETMLFMALSLAVLWLTFRELDQRSAQPKAVFLRGLALGAVGGLLFLTRPEGALLLGLVGLAALLTWGREYRRRYFLWAAGAGIGFVVVISPYTAWNYHINGDLLPATASAKIAENAPLREASLLERYANMILPLIAGAQFIAAPAIAMGMFLILRQARKDPKRWLLLLPPIWAAAHLTLFVLRLPAPYQHGRYVMPVLPPLLIYVAGGMGYWLEHGKNSMIGRVLSRSLALSTALAFPAFLWIGGQAYANDVRIINTEMVETAQWVRDNIPPSELFAVHDIGALGYYAPRQILDLAGLVSPEVVPIITDHAKLMTLICQRGAKWLMVLPDQRPVGRDDPRLTVVYESPYDYADAAQGDPREKWKMRVYAVDCD